MGLLGIITERLVFRPLMTRWTDIDTIMVSIGLFIVLENAAQLFFGATPRMINDPFGGRTLDLGVASTSLLRLFCFAFAGVAIACLELFLNRSRHGGGHPGHQPEPLRGPTHGIDINQVYRLTFGVGAPAGRGWAGCSTAPSSPSIPPWGPAHLEGLRGTILGGLGNIRGAIWAA